MTHATATPSSPPLTALVTGASGGLGAELARQLAAYGTGLVLVSPEEAALEALAAELRGRFGVPCVVLALDLSNPAKRDWLEQECERRSLTVDVLVNNAGIGDYGPFTALSPARQQTMIELNIAALTDLTHRFLPGMVARRRGRVLNVASTAAFMPGPLMAVYYATKAYVLSFSEALREEVRGSGVYVTALCPGPMRTPFVTDAGMQRSQVFLGGVRELLVVEPREVARQGLEAMWRGDGVLVTGAANRLATLVPRLMPRPLMPRLLYEVQRPREK